MTDVTRQSDGRHDPRVVFFIVYSASKNGQSGREDTICPGVIYRVQSIVFLLMLDIAAGLV